MIVQNGYVFPHRRHENPVYGPFERPYNVQSWWGVRGAKTYVGRSQTREISLRATLTNFPVESVFNSIRRDLETALDAGLSGPLTINSTTFPQCLFLGWFPEGDRDGQAWYSPLVDSNGIQGWTQRGVLRWLETKVYV
jgi:hypothetical protein